MEEEQQQQQEEQVVTKNERLKELSGAVYHAAINDVIVGWDGVDSYTREFLVTAYGIGKTVRRLTSNGSGVVNLDTRLFNLFQTSEFAPTYSKSFIPKDCQNLVEEWKNVPAIVITVCRTCRDEIAADFLAADFVSHISVIPEDHKKPVALVANGSRLLSKSCSEEDNDKSCSEEDGNDGDEHHRVTFGTTQRFVFLVGKCCLYTKFELENSKECSYRLGFFFDYDQHYWIWNSFFFIPQKTIRRGILYTSGLVGRRYGYAEDYINDDVEVIHTIETTNLTKSALKC